MDNLHAPKLDYFHDECIERTQSFVDESHSKERKLTLDNRTFNRIL